MAENVDEQLAPTELTDSARRTRAPGDRSRARVLEQAAALATLEGLEGISIAGLANATGMPKSSVYALFGSKEQLQLATIDAARTSFITHVVNPALATTPAGRQRLLQLCDGYLDYIEQRIFPGGCFFVTAGAEMGGRRGPVRDLVALYQRQWRELLVQTARDAHAAGELPGNSDPDQLAFELGAILAETNIWPSCTTTTRSSRAGPRSQASRSQAAGARERRSSGAGPTRPGWRRLR
jgi:AcrR family transcriptional regulator